MGYGLGGVRITGGEVILKSRRHLKAASRDCARCAAARFALSRSRPRPLSTRAPADGPVVEAALLLGVAGGPRQISTRPVSKTPPAGPREHRPPLPAPGLGRSVAVSDDGHGPMLRTQPDRLDEPTSALDVTTQIDVLAAIKDAIRDTGVAAPLHYT